MFDFNGNFIKSFNNFRQAALFANTDQTMVKENLYGIRKRVKNYIFSFDKNFKDSEINKINQYNEKEELVNTFSTLEEAAKKLNVKVRFIQFRLQKENTNLSKSKYKFNLRYSNRTNGSLLSKIIVQ